MKITCPKCHASYRVDLPDPGEAGIDVQCGKCLYIFLFSSDTERPDPSQIKKGASANIQDSGLSEDRPSEPILPPQKDEDQEVSDSPKQASLPTGEEPEATEELELEPIADEAEHIEIVVEDDTPEESLEEVALDDIWNQAVQEGARTVAQSKEKSPNRSEASDEQAAEGAPPPPEEKSKRLPSLEDRQKEIDRMITDHQTQQKELETSPSDEKSEPLSARKEEPDKTQEEIDLEERVVIDEGEAMPNWEDAFVHQAKVEEGWQKAQEQDRILEEQQLSDALGKKEVTGDPPPEETAETVQDKQSLVDQIFAETKSSQESPKETTETPQPEAESQEEIDLEEQVVIDEGEVMPSWEEAFADQSEVEARWGKAQEKDRIHEEQQLADALGEEYVPSEPPAEETPAPAMLGNKQDIVDQLFAEVQSQQETGEQPEASTRDETLEVDGEKTPSAEIQETHVGEHTIPGEIDLMTDLDDLNMKQLVTQAFKEESKSQEKLEETATDDEATQEPELTMESLAEALQDTEPSTDDPAPEMESIPELTLESAEEEPEPVDANKQEEETEVEPIPELTLESAEEESKDKTTADLESLLDAAETPEEVEALIAELPLKMESESELTMESDEETQAPADLETKAPVAESVISPESLLDDKDEEDEQIWNDLLPEQNEEEQLAEVEAEAPVAFNEEEEEKPFEEENDFWDQVLEKDTQDTQTTEPQPVASAPVPGTAEREALTDEELWKQAFPGEEEFETTTSQPSGEGEGDPQSEPEPLVIGATVSQKEDSEDSLKYDEAAYADYDDNDDEFEFERRKRKLGPFIIPHGKRGDLVIGGVMVVFLLLAGSIYFTLQTFAPGELTDGMQTAKTDVPEGLTPRDVPLDELAGDLITSKPTVPEKTPPVDTPGDKGDAVLSDPADILKESPEEKGILKDLAESQILKDTGKSQTAKIDQSALQALSGNSITLSTIMPVAYNPTDIRVLSFSVEIQLSDAQSAKRVRESLPVYEELMNQTVENFLRRKFYNDILYVKEKLQKRLQTAMNQSLKNGRVKKAKFTDFAIQ